MDIVVPKRTRVATRDETATAADENVNDDDSRSYSITYTVEPLLSCQSEFSKLVRPNCSFVSWFSHCSSCGPTCALTGQDCFLSDHFVWSGEFTDQGNASDSDTCVPQRSCSNLLITMITITDERHEFGLGDPRHAVPLLSL